MGFDTCPCCGHWTYGWEVDYGPEVYTFQSLKPIRPGPGTLKLDCGCEFDTMTVTADAQGNQVITGDCRLRVKPLSPPLGKEAEPW